MHCQTVQCTERAWTRVEDWAFRPLSGAVESRSIAATVQQLTQRRPAEPLVTPWRPDDPLRLVDLLPELLVEFDYYEPTPLTADEEPAIDAMQLDAQMLHRALSLILTGCPPGRLVERLVALWPETLQKKQLANRLWQVQMLASSGCGLATAREHLRETKPTAGVTAGMMVPTALYGFLCAPDDGRLALLRVAQLDSAPRVTCALTGALLGAYRGPCAMPLSWRRCACPDDGPSVLRSLWGVSSEATLLQLSDQLAAAWSGVYYPMGDRAIAMPAFTRLPRDRQAIVL